MGPGKALAIFKNTSLAYEGQAGSTLPQMAPQAKWKAGSEVEVGWWILAQHGGGYSYRLAPADKPLTEAEFQRMPLGKRQPCDIPTVFVHFRRVRDTCCAVSDFVGPGILRWGGNVSSQLEFNATRTTEGTFPAGSMWSRNPIPRFPEQWETEGPSFEPVCQESKACNDLATSCTKGICFTQGDCRCSGAPTSILCCLPKAVAGALKFAFCCFRGSEKRRNRRQAQNSCLPQAWEIRSGMVRTVSVALSPCCPARLPAVCLATTRLLVHEAPWYTIEINRLITLAFPLATLAAQAMGLRGASNMGISVVLNG